MIKFLNRFFLNLLVFPIGVIAQSHFIPQDLKTFLNTNQCEYCDLSNIVLVNLANEHTSAKLHGAILDGINAPYMTLDLADLSSTVCINAILSNMSASSANFDNANLYNVMMDGANLSHSSFKNTNFTYAHLTSATLTSGDFTGANFKGAYLDDADFQFSNVTSSQLAEAWTMNGLILPDGTVCKDKQACISIFYSRRR